MRIVALVTALFATPAIGQQVVLIDFSSQPSSDAQIDEVQTDEPGNEAVRDSMHKYLLPEKISTVSEVGRGTACDAVAPMERRGFSRELQQRRERYWPIVAAAECTYGLPVGLLDALIIQESGYRSVAVSRKGAGGLTQLMPGTASDLGVIDRSDPHMNVDGGARYLRDQLQKFKSVPLALAAYNAGPKAVKDYGGVPPYRETKDYIARILDIWNGMDNSSAYIMRTAVRLGFVTTE